MAASCPIVFVLAMSRTGTSAITRILSLTGMTLPIVLLAANDGNPMGYWEPAEVVALNDRFLAERGSSYYDPTFRLQSDDMAFESGAANDFVNEIAAFIALQGEDAPLLIKDPRLVSLAPYWYRGAVRAGRTVRCILPVRDPRAVIASLSARDGTSFAYGNVLWLKYTLLAERLSRRFPRVFIDYSTAIADWRPQVKRVSRELGVPTHRRRAAVVDAFVDPRLDHHDRDGISREALLPLTDIVYEQVLQAAEGGTIDRTVMDDAYALFRNRERLVSHSALGGPESVPKWDAVGMRVARALAKGPPFPSA